MNRFRARQYGDSEWTYVSLEGELADYLAGMIGSSIKTRHLHVQIDVDGEWEDL